MKNIKKHIHGIFGSLLFLGATVVLLLIFGFTTPLPLPVEEGIILDFTSSGSDQNSFDISQTEKLSNNYSDAAEKLLNDINDNPFIPGDNISDEVINPNQNKLNSLFENVFNSDNAGDDKSSNYNSNPGIEGDNNGPDRGYGELEGTRSFTKVDPESKDNMYGLVVLKITVSELGKVTDVSLVSTSCDQCVLPAINAVKKWKYEALPGSGYQVGTVRIEFKQK
ncbi:MAG: TonB family protein [Bacteroidales bacterium]|nr:TonB family protein [Bacteroidales bacterium]